MLAACSSLALGVPAAPCLDAFVQMICTQGGVVACDALRRERARQPAQVAAQEAECLKAQADPIFIGRTQMALTLADRLLGHGKPLIPDDSDHSAPAAFHADEQIEFDLQPDSFNSTEINDPQVEEFFEAILEDPDMRPHGRVVPTVRRQPQPGPGPSPPRAARAAARRRDSNPATWATLQAPRATTNVESRIEDEAVPMAGGLPEDGDPPEDGNVEQFGA